MNIRFDQLTKGLLSLAVILMFTIALIADQARANLPEEAKAAPEFDLARHVSVVLDPESLRKIDSLPHVVDTILALPIEIELTLRTGAADDAGSDQSLLQ